jgi:hypothetical protein
LNLIVENATVGDYDDRVEDLLVIALHANQLVREPCNGIGFAAARRVLDQIALACSIAVHVGQRLANYAKLVIARPHLAAFLPAGALVLFFNDLRIVFEDVGQPLRGENLFPQIVCLESVWVRWITGTVVVALVKWQKP